MNSSHLTIKSELFAYTSPFYYLALVSSPDCPAMQPSGWQTPMEIGQEPWTGCNTHHELLRSLSTATSLPCSLIPQLEAHPVKLLFLIFQNGEGGKKRVISILELLREGDGIKSHF